MTAPTSRKYIFFWTGLCAAFLAFLWLFNGILTPFVLGMAIAYLLDPVVDRLEKMKFPRSGAVALILALFFLFAALLMALIWPTLQREAGQLAEALPAMTESLWSIIAPYIQMAQEKLGGGDADPLKKLLLDNTGRALTAGGGILAGLGNGGQAVAGFLGALIITPLVAFFMMKEWDGMKDWIDNLLPRASRDTIRDLMRRIDKKIAGFVRGQISVACVLALFYGIGLLLCDLKFGFIIGVLSGLLYIIPYLGTAFGLIAGLAAAFFQGIGWALVVKIAGVFIAGQILETYFLTPKLVGNSVGLHPLWILFAVMAGGALFGLTGMLLAVPVAAIAGVLLAFAIAHYKKSSYYKGKD